MFRGYSLDQLWSCEFEDMLHLMVWGRYPTPSQSESLRRTLASLMADIPKTVFEVIEKFPSVTYSKNNILVLC
jgi:citrate synthase